MQIPTQVKVGRKPYRVLKIKSATNVLGRCYPEAQVLHVATQHTERKLPEAKITETFWHELTHAILHDMGHPLWRDERFVVAFSQRLNNAIRSARFDT